MKDKKSMSMVIIVGIIISLFLFVNTTVFATTGTVVTSDLRLRKEESTSSEVLDLLDENDKVEIISENGDWYKVKANGKVGYVSKEYIKVKDENNQNTQNIVSENKNETEQKPEENSEENKDEKNTTTENPSQENPTEENTNKDNTQEEQKTEVPSKCKFASDVQLKVMPIINGIVINNTKADEEYDVVSNAGVWSYVKSGNKAGWVLTEKITAVSTEKTEGPKPEEKQEEPKEENKQDEKIQKTEDPKAEEPADTNYSSPKTYYVKGTSVNARSKANKDAEVVKVLNTNNSVKVTGENGNWYVVEINGQKAYISKSLLSKEKVEVTSRSSNSLNEGNNQKTEVQTPAPVEKPAEQPVASNPSGAAIVQYAKTFLGYRYVYGTAGPNTFDCSGFVQYVYKHFGYSLSRSSGTQANDGVAVSKSNLQPGDVLIFRDTSNSRIGHVGIYIGDGQFIHASNSRTGVIISSLSTSAYQKRYVGARRIL